MTEPKNHTPANEPVPAMFDRETIKSRLRSRLAEAGAETKLGRILADNFKAQWLWAGSPARDRAHALEATRTIAMKTLFDLGD